MPSRVTEAKIRAAAEQVNSDAQWDLFDSRSYAEHNYATLLDADRQIIKLVGDFFAAAGVTNGRGIDVGAGANLYPTMSMLPFCRDILLLERAPTNVTWLTEQIHGYDAEKKAQGYERSWDPFWAEFAAFTPYAALPDPRARLSAVATVRREDLFDFHEDERRDIGTMFFVAESLTSDHGEFEQATESFLATLKDNAPFAAAFMENSTGYEVGTEAYPAVAIEGPDVFAVLSRHAHDLVVERIDSPDTFRDGYTGMLLALGRTRRRDS